LRKGNFDLLVLLATQESIHRVLMMKDSDTKNAKKSEDYDDDDDDDEECPISVMSRSNRQFLSNFYLQRLVSHFTGRQPYGRADQFLQELLRSTPSMVMASDETAATAKSSSSSNDEEENAISCLVDPTRIAEQILEMRQVVAREWAARAAQVPERHMDLKRLQLNHLLDSRKSSNNDPDGGHFQ